MSSLDYCRLTEITYSDSDSDIQPNIDINMWRRLKQRMREEKRCIRCNNLVRSKTKQTTPPSTSQSNVSICNGDCNKKGSNEYTYEQLLNSIHEKEAKIDQLTQKLHETEANLKAAQDETKILKQKINEITALNKQLIAAGKQYDGDFEIINLKMIGQESIMKSKESNDEWILI